MNHSFIFEFIHERPTLGTGIVAEAGGKGFIKPKVVPPVHCDQISKPHVAKFVHYNNDCESQLRDRHLLDA